MAGGGMVARFQDCRTKILSWVVVWRACVCSENLTISLPIIKSLWENLEISLLCMFGSTSGGNGGCWYKVQKHFMVGGGIVGLSKHVHSHHTTSHHKIFLQEKFHAKPLFF